MKIDPKDFAHKLTQHQCEQHHLTHEIVRTYQSMMNVFSREVGMSSSRILILKQIAVEYPEGVGTMEIARKLGINAAAVTRQVAELEELELVERCDDPNDGRRRSVRLTDKGIELLQEMHTRVVEFETLIGKGLDNNELATTIKVLTYIRNVLHDI